MQMPSRQDLARIGYTGLGGGAAILWNRYFPLRATGAGYIPPATLALIILMLESTGEREKNLAASILGYTCAAQAISFTKPLAKVGELPESLQGVDNPRAAMEAEAAKLHKIKAVTGTLGAIAEIVGKFKGN